jgi:hypothetical protein
MSRLTDHIHRPILVSALRTLPLSADCAVLRDIGFRYDPAAGIVRRFSSLEQPKLTNDLGAQTNLN